MDKTLKAAIAFAIVYKATLILAVATFALALTGCTAQEETLLAQEETAVELFDDVQTQELEQEAQELEEALHEQEENLEETQPDALKDKPTAQYAQGMYLVDVRVTCVEPSVIADTVVCKDADGQLFAFEGSGYAEGDKLTLVMHDAGTPGGREDDTIEYATVMLDA